jgi:hypothetical protein
MAGCQTYGILAGLFFGKRLYGPRAHASPKGVGG